MHFESFSYVAERCRKSLKVDVHRKTDLGQSIAVFGKDLHIVAFCQAFCERKIPFASTAHGLNMCRVLSLAKECIGGIVWDI